MKKTMQDTWEFMVLVNLFCYVCIAFRYLTLARLILLNMYSFPSHHFYQQANKSPKTSSCVVSAKRRSPCNVYSTATSNVTVTSNVTCVCFAARDLMIPLI